MLMRFDPFRGTDPLSQWFGRQQSGGSRQFAMPMDACRDGDRFIVDFDLPGVNPDSIDLTVEKNVLTCGPSERGSHKTGAKFSSRSGPMPPSRGSCSWGDNLDTASIAATFCDGVLTLTIPVAEQAKPRKVAITRGNGEGASITANASEKSTSEKATSGT